MEKFEESVLDYICGRPQRFVNAQFEIPFDGLRGGSCPDFVVIDFADRTIYVVEVSVAAAVGRLVERVRARETRWLGPLRDHFRNLNPIFKDASWDWHVTVFVRREQLEAAQQTFGADRNVSVLCLDDTVFSWRWDWGPGIPANPLRATGKERCVS
jgi:hypothetical protein